MKCTYTYKNKSYTESELDSVLKAEESKEVTNRLLPILHSMGVSVESIENYEKITGTKINADVTALADGLRRIIAVNDNKADETTIPEEMMHLVLPNYEDTRQFEKAMLMVELTEEYRQWEDVYREKYKGDERLVRLEILGKIGAKHLINNVKRESDFRLMQALRSLWKRFKSLFKKNSELDQFLQSISNDILDGKVTSVTTDIPVMYQIDDKYAGLIQRMIDSLALRLKSFEREGLSHEGVSKTIDDLAQAENTQGLVMFLEHMSENATAALKYVKKVQKGKEKVSSKLLMDMSDFISYYEPYAHELRQILLFDKGVPYKKKDKKAMKKTLQGVTVAFEKIKDFRDNQRIIQSIEIADQNAADEFNLDRNDPQFYEKVQAELGYDYREELKETHQNSNFFEFWVGAPRDASDEIIRMIANIVRKAKQKVFRETVDFGRDLLNKAKSLGLDHKSMTWAYEKDVKGRYTGRFINETKDAEWKLNKALEAKKIFASIGLPENDYKTINKWREEGIHKDKLDVYGRAWKKWYNDNTKVHPLAAERYQEMKDMLEAGEIDLVTYQAWFNTNVWVSKSGNEYFQGSLVVPSDKWINNDYGKLSPQQVEFLQYVKVKKAEIDEQLPGVSENNLAPQILESMVDIIHRKNGSIFRQLGHNIADTFITKEEDEQYFGQRFVKRPDGSLQKYIPTHFTKLLGGSDLTAEERAVETNKISTDLISTMTAYKQMQSNYKEMSKVAPDLDLIQEQLGVRRVLDKKGQELPDAKNYTFKVVDKFLEMNVYGRNKELKEINAFGKTINLTKSLSALSSYVRNVNLAWNPFTSFSNAVQSSVASKVEDLIGYYSTNSSKLVANKEFLKNLAPIMKEYKDTVKTNKLSLLLERFEMGDNLYSMFDNLDKSKLTKKAIASGLYWSYEVTDFVIKGKMLIAMLDNYRQLPDGSYKTREQYKGDNWNDLPTMWEQVTVKDGKLDFHNDKLLDKVARKVQYVGNMLDGSLNPEDYAAAHQGAITQLVTVHRSWLFSGLQRRFKKKGYNWSAGMKEQGYYLSTWEFLKSNIMNQEKMDRYKQWTLRWQELSPVEKAAVKRTAIEHAFILTTIVIAKTLNSLADDDDDYDMAAYLSNRVVMEVAAFSIVPPIAISEMANTISSPLVPMRQVELMFDWGDMLFGDEEIESGQWEGYSKRQRALLKLIPIIKPNILWHDVSAANQFMKSKPLKMIY